MRLLPVRNDRDSAAPDEMKKVGGTGIPRALAFTIATWLILLAGCGTGATTGVENAYLFNRTDSREEWEGLDLEIHCFSAGKADAFLLSTPNSAVLIDAGEKGFGKEILSYLEEKGISRLDRLILTHFDQDHVGGAAKVINNLEIGAVLQSNRPKDSSEYSKYRKALQNASIEPVTVRETYDFILDGVQYSIDPPRRSQYNKDSSNNSSLMISVRNGQNHFLFAGDAQTERLEEFLEWNRTSYEVLKVPHHGREEPLLADLIESVSPAYAVITSSDEEPEDMNTVELLEQAGVQVFFTRLGAVTMYSNGTDIQISYTAP